MSEKIVGILGGMGPEATADFFTKVIALSPAGSDQDHLRIIIDNNPKIPDRTKAILNVGESPLSELIKTAKNLEKAGVDFIVIPCNTAHYFYEDLIKEVTVPLLHMIREVADAIKTSLPECKKVGLLATTGTVTSNLYQRDIQQKGIEVITPDVQGQAKVMDAITKIKAGQKDIARKLLVEIGKLLIKNKAEAIILGCTDIPVVIKTTDFTVPVFDSNMVLAEATTRFATN
jgi:aspartate racemase